jgi:asparagine synthase (glutamine-hydrolysing)
LKNLNCSQGRRISSRFATEMLSPTIGDLTAVHFMSGIFGVLTYRLREDAEDELLRMLTVSQRGDSSECDTWTHASSGIYLGVIKSVDAGAAPILQMNESRRVVLGFSGNDFSEAAGMQHVGGRELRLRRDGARSVVQLYEEDLSFPACLNGRFHGLLTDLNRETAMLFNDRYGMHRLYYYEAADGLYFASEAKAILAVRPELRRADYQSLGEFVSCGAVLENRTLFNGIRVLPPGSAWIFRKGELVGRGTYFQPREWEEQETLDPETYYQELRTNFMRSLPRYFSGSDPIGMSLTGGLDTRIILANHKAEPGALPCYTFGSMFRDNEDVRVACKVAAVCGQSHQVLTAGTEFLERFADYAERTVYLTDGSADVSRAPDLYLNERAREITPIRMTGVYGGEILRGVRAFKPIMPAAELFSHEFVPRILHAAETYTEAARCNPVSFAAFKQGPWYLQNVLALEETQIAMRSPYLDNDFVRTVFRSPVPALASNEVSLRLVADGNPKLFEIPTDRGLAGRHGQLTGAVVRSTHEFLFKAEYAYDMGMPQWLARVDHAFSVFRLERLFLGRHKPFHFRVWYRDHLAAYVKEMLLDDRSLSRPYIDRKGLESAVREHTRGRRNYTTELHKVLSLELVHRLFLDGPVTVRKCADNMSALSRAAF